MGRWSVGMRSVAIGLSSLVHLYAQTESEAERAAPWNWLTTKKAASPPKPSADESTANNARTDDKVLTHVLRQTTCNIPFTVDPAKNVETELQLYVSQDRGATWKFYSKAVPTAGS